MLVSLVMTLLLGGNNFITNVSSEETVTLTLTATDGGTINPSPGNYTYTIGTVVHITMTADEGWCIDHVKLNKVGEWWGCEWYYPLTFSEAWFTVDHNYTIHVHFHRLLASIGKTYSLPVANSPWMMIYTDQCIWWRGGLSILRFDLTKAMVNVSQALSSWRVAPETEPNGTGYHESFDIGLAYGGGYFWSSVGYREGEHTAYYLSRFDPTTHEYRLWNCSYLVNPRSMIFDGNDTIYIAVEQGIAKFSVSELSWKGRMNTYPYQGLVTILLMNDKIYFTGANVGGIGHIDLDGTNLGIYNATTPVTWRNSFYLTADENGVLWASTTSAVYRIHMIGKLVGTTIKEYDLSEDYNSSIQCGDGPYGLCFDDQGKLWVAGWYSHCIFCFDPETETYNGYDAGNPDGSNMPYYLVKDDINNIWGWGEGSVDMNLVELSLDINNDGTVNIVDIVAVGLAFDSTPQSPNWNKRCDLNYDSAVNIIDIVRVALHFDETYP